MPSTDKPLDFKRLAPILLIVLVDIMGLTIIIPILPYYALTYNAGATTIGLLGAAYPLMQFLGGPPLTALSDRFGRKPVLAAAQIGTFCSLLLLGFANALWLVFLARILDGLTGANLPTVQAAVSDATTGRTRAQGLGMVGATIGLGFVLGPALSGVALRLSGNNYSAPAFVAAGFAALAVIMTLFAFQETLPPDRRARGSGARRGVLAFGQMGAALRNPAINTLFVLIFGQQLIIAAFQTMFAPYTLNRLGLNSLGNTIFFLATGILSVTVQGGLIGRLTARFGERRLLLGGLLMMTLALSGIALAPQQAVPWYSRVTLLGELSQAGTTLDAAQLALLPPETGRGLLALVQLVGAIMLLYLGSSLFQPSINSLLTQRVPPTEIGQTLGLAAAFLSLANVLGPLWSGFVFDAIAPAAPFAIAALLAALLLLFSRRQRPALTRPG